MTTSVEQQSERSLLKDIAVLAVWFALPYLLVGVFWADAHHAHLSNVHGMDRTMSYLGEMVAWPVLIFSDVTLE